MVPCPFGWAKGMGGRVSGVEVGAYTLLPHSVYPTGMLSCVNIRSQSLTGRLLHSASSPTLSHVAYCVLLRSEANQYSVEK